MLKLHPCPHPHERPCRRSRNDLSSCTPVVQNTWLRHCSQQLFYIFERWQVSLVPSAGACPHPENAWVTCAPLVQNPRYATEINILYIPEGGQVPHCLLTRAAVTPNRKFFSRIVPSYSQNSGYATEIEIFLNSRGDGQVPHCPLVRAAITPNRKCLSPHCAPGIQKSWLRY